MRLYAILILSVLNLTAVSSRAADDGIRVYGQPMRWATAYERQTNFVNQYCPFTHTAYAGNSSSSYNFPYQARDEACVHEAQMMLNSKLAKFLPAPANIKTLSDDYCTAKVKQDFLDGLPVPYACLAPANPLTLTQRLTTDAEVVDRQEELISTLTGNGGFDARGRVKNLVKQMVEEVEAERTQQK